MKRISVALVAVASMMFAATALAHAPSHPSHLFVDGFDFTSSLPDGYYTVGHVESPASKCVAHRTVKVFYGYETESDFRLVDVAKTGQSGAFGAEGPVSHGGNQVTALKLKLVDKKVGRQTCKGDTLRLD
ncbi:MAG: hypothetical protein ACRDLL_02415 [Solirubrobacterales bacterium]